MKVPEIIQSSKDDYDLVLTHTHIYIYTYIVWLVVEPTPLKNMSQLG